MNAFDAFAHLKSEINVIRIFEKGSFLLLFPVFYVHFRVMISTRLEVDLGSMIWLELWARTYEKNFVENENFFIESIKKFPFSTEFFR